MQSVKWAYDMSDKELIDEFMNACARAGTSNSGLVFDISAGHQLAEAYYLKGVLFARLAGEKPPFKRGDKVTLRTDAIHKRSTNRIGEGWYIDAKPAATYEVWRIHFVEGHWELSFLDGKERNSYRFHAASFALVEEKQSEVA